jgi:hypothetical protein
VNFGRLGGGTYQQGGSTLLIAMDDLVDDGVVTALGSQALGGNTSAVVYADRQPRPAGDVEVGPHTVRTDQPTVLVFRDEMPGANWMHPCTYALVSIDTGDVVASATADRPPVFGRLPDTWLVVDDPSGRADLL